MQDHRRLIVNADGFGFGPGATQGVIDAVRKGRFITSVSVNANFADAEHIGEFAREFPAISIGVHLNPAVGRPCLSPGQVASLVDDHGFFRGDAFPSLLRRGTISATELEAELEAQIARVRDLVGNQLTHLDSQENTHLGYLELVVSLARKWKVPCMRTNDSLICLESANPRFARCRTYLWKPHVWAVHQYRRLQMSKARRAGMRLADRLITVGYGGTGSKANAENWLRILKNLPRGTFEIYCHPAYPDSTLRRWSYYYEERRRELEILQRDDLRDAARESGIELVSFFAL